VALDPVDVAVDRAGNVYVATSNSVDKVDPRGVITTVAGSGAASGPLGDGGPATAAPISRWPWR